MQRNQEEFQPPKTVKALMFEGVEYLNRNDLLLVLYRSLHDINTKLPEVSGLKKAITIIENLQRD